MVLSTVTHAQTAEFEGRIVTDRLSLHNDTTSNSMTDLTLRKVIQSHGTIHADGTFSNHNNIDKVLILHNKRYKIYFKDIYRDYLPTCTVTPMTHSITRITNMSNTSVTFELSDHTGIISGVFNYQCN